MLSLSGMQKEYPFIESISHPKASAHCIPKKYLIYFHLFDCIKKDLWITFIIL